MDIKFYWNGSFCGTNHAMIVNGKDIGLCGVISNEEEAKIEAIKILKQDFGIEYNINEIKFEWGGRL
jgi:hypothetical protein